MTEIVGPAKRPTTRDDKEQFRVERHREFLSVALGIVTDRGLGELTMPGLADELSCGIGTLYRHFPSKDALIAELQREALDIIITSFQLSQAHLDELLAAQRVADPAVVALARLVVAARFWIAAETEFPQEIDLSRRIFTDPTVRLDDHSAARIVPVAMRLLDLARSRVDEAIAVGAVSDAPSVQRAIIVIAGTTGVLMTSGLSRWDRQLFDGQELATVMLRDLLIGWGADPAHLAAVDGLVDHLTEHGHLVPVARQ